MRSGAAAQSDYPSRPVRIIVNSAPGGGTDILARVITQQMQQLARTLRSLEKEGVRNVFALSSREEVDSATVHGKAGRADSDTDPAPLEMFETPIQFKPREQWRPGMTPDRLRRHRPRL